MKAGGQAAVSGDVARGEAVPRLPHAPAGLKIPLRRWLPEAAPAWAWHVVRWAAGGSSLG